MADRVEVIVERLVLEMAQLVEAGIFTETEARKIMKNRKQQEYLVQRPATTTADFLRAFIFESKLEKIRAKRTKELKQAKTAKYDFFILKRIMHIFDRLLRKVPNNLELWKLYIDYLIKQNCNRKVGLVLARALRIHP